MSQLSPQNWSAVTSTSWRSSETYALVAISAATFTDAFLYGVAVPVLPFALASKAGVSATDVQLWTSILLASYGAAVLLTSLVLGWAADHFASRRTPLLIGFVVCGVSTALLCVGTTIPTLVTGRFLQGVSSAIVWVVGLAVLVDSSEPERIGRVMGYVALSMSVGTVAAPLIGGVVFARLGYTAVFAIASSLVAVDFVLRVILVIPNRRSQSLSPSPSTSLVNRDSYNHKTGLPVVITSPVVQERTSRVPPLLRLLHSRRLLTALLVCLVQSAIQTAFDALLPLFVKEMFNWASIGAGLIFLPLMGASFLGPVVGHLTDRYGSRWLATAGLLLSCPALALLREVRHDGYGQKVLLCVLLGILGVALTLVLVSMMAEITSAVLAKETMYPTGFFGKTGATAQSCSFFNITWSCGCMIGPLIGGVAVDRIGWGNTTLVLANVCAVTAIPTALWTGARRAQSEDDIDRSRTHDG